MFLCFYVCRKQACEHGPTQIETEDSGNGGGGGYPGAAAQGERGQEEGGTVRVRDIEGEEDLANQVLHPCDNQLVAVFGNSIQCNDGRHLDGSIADDGIWQGRYDRVVSHPHPMYNSPKGGVGQRVLQHWQGNSGACVSGSGTRNTP
jgi:hypothetical protein